MKKTFVSLSFSIHKLQVLQLNSSKTKVLKFGEVDIPVGLIEGSKVTDPQKMAVVIKSAYKQFGLKEKTVGIVLPEFSTYTRTLTLPVLSDKDLDEAVNWKMKEFLPNSGAGMVMDWRILSKLGNNNQVLVVSISELVLASFVVSVEYAGLYPLVVETPSLSLARAAGKDPDLKMVVYAQNSEALILYLRGEEILTSAVSLSTDASSLIKLAYQMSRHYIDSPAKKLLLGGLDITQETLKQFQDSLKLPITWLKMETIGLTPEQMQEYLIPLSLQHKDTAAPISEMTINLLPHRWAQSYASKRVKDQIWLLTLVSAMIILICFLVTLGSNLVMQRQLTDLTQVNPETVKASDDLVTLVKAVNTKADNVNKIMNASKNPVEVINKITSSQPAGVVLGEYNVDLEDGNVIVSGVAADRQALVEFKNQLDAIEEFGDVDVPLDALQQSTNINFDFSFQYLPAVAAKPTPVPRLNPSNK